MVLQARSLRIDNVVSLEVWFARQKIGFWAQLGTMSPGSLILPRDLSLTSNQENQLLNLLETCFSFL